MKAKWLRYGAYPALAASAMSSGNNWVTLARSSGSFRSKETSASDGVTRIHGEASRVVEPPAPHALADELHLRRRVTTGWRAYQGEVGVRWAASSPAGHPDEVCAGNAHLGAVGRMHLICARVTGIVGCHSSRPGNARGIRVADGERFVANERPTEK